MNCLKHSVYSPDIASTVCYLFLNLKIFFVGNNFTSNDKDIATIDGYIADTPEPHFNDGFELLEIC